MNLGSLGEIAEDKVTQYLKTKGFYIARRNYHCRYGEIDIIAENDALVLFVEVKARNEDSIVSPAQAVDRYKASRIIKTATDYIRKSHCDLQPRFDVAEVTVFEREDNTHGYRLNYIKNAIVMEAGNGIF